MQSSRRLYSVSFYLLVIILFLFRSGYAQSADRIVGRWQDASNPEKKIVIFESQGKYFGKSSNENSENVKPGTTVFKNLEWNKNTNEYKGTVINPDNNEEYKTTIILTDDDHFQFKVSVLFITKTIKFIRIKN